MADAIYGTLSHMMKLKDNEMGVVSHNLSNANTNGFKEDKISFSTVMDQKTGKKEPVVVKTSVNFSQGALLDTHNDLDFGLDGTGFFEVQSEKGTFYTRNGSLSLNNEGVLVTGNGERIMGKDGIIQIDEAGPITVSRTGEVKVNGNEKGQLKVVGFSDLKGLDPVGNGLFKVNGSAQTFEDTQTSVLQGKIEQSNTSVMGNLVKLIEISRNYQAYQKAMSYRQQNDQEAISSLARLS